MKKTKTMKTYWIVLDKDEFGEYPNTYDSEKAMQGGINDTTVKVLKVSTYETFKAKKLTFEDKFSKAA